MTKSGSHQMKRCAAATLTSITALQALIIRAVCKQYHSKAVLPDLYSYKFTHSQLGHILLRLAGHQALPPLPEQVHVQVEARQWQNCVQCSLPDTTSYAHIPSACACTCCHEAKGSCYLSSVVFIKHQSFAPTLSKQRAADSKDQACRHLSSSLQHAKRSMPHAPFRAEAQCKATPRAWPGSSRRAQALAAEAGIQGAGQRQAAQASWRLPDPVQHAVRSMHHRPLQSKRIANQPPPTGARRRA